jgi:PAS domain-containing protein
MNRLAVQFLDQGFHRMLFEAMPMPVFVVNEDVCILECNAAAANCIHASEVPEGCGRSPDCGGCVVRKSVRAASRGHSVVRHEAKMQFGHNGNRNKANLRVTCQPFTYERRTFILLILEGLKD